MDFAAPFGLVYRVPRDLPSLPQPILLPDVPDDRIGQSSLRRPLRTVPRRIGRRELTTEIRASRTAQRTWTASGPGSREVGLLAQKVIYFFQLSNTGIVVTSLTAGAIAGAAAKTTIAPLDRTKINFQISEKPYSAKEAIKFLVRTYQQEGLISLWRGNSATMARIIPYSAIQFTAHEQWKRVLHIDMDKDKNTSPQLRFLAGSLAGVTSQSLTYPLDLARARMAVTHKEKYGTLKEVFVKTWIEEGPRAFYRGYLPTVLGVIPYAGVSFFTYDTLKKKYIDYTGNPTLNPAASLLFGAAAGMLGQSSSYPLDIVRRRMQTSPLTGTHYRSIFSTLKKVYRDEGIRRGFFKGLSMNWVKGPVAVGISFTTYDILKDFLRLSIIYRR
uniref:Solute carrier family 25 member 42 n=1 Tax=Timema poppense TaxID=170557 RepID=A0A7R9H1Y3_TIMPO|nr:unnamed protein product [Timema poppensis]